MKYTEKDLYKGMKLRCTDDGLYNFWKKGAIYTVEENSYDSLVIRGEGDRSDRPTYDILNYLNGETLVKMEVVEEEKEVTKYVEVTKLIDWSSDPELLEVGKVYKVVEEYKDMLYVKGVSIYVNEEHQSYYLRSDQFKYVEGPVADIKVDVKEAIQDKIDELRTEAEHLFKKRDRLEQHGINLNKKAQKLKEVLETIKEFE